MVAFALLFFIETALYRNYSKSFFGGGISDGSLHCGRFVLGGGISDRFVLGGGISDGSLFRDSFEPARDGSLR